MSALLELDRISLDLPIRGELQRVIHDVSLTIGAGESVRRDSASCSRRSLSPETTGRVGCAIETIESVGIAGAIVAG